MRLIVALTLLSVSMTPAAIPGGPTSAAALSAPGFAHQEVLRIDRDFGKPQWQLAVDGWVTDTAPHRVEEMRLWWVNVDEADRRKPFSRSLRRFVKFDFAHRPDGDVDVRLAGDGKEYRFVVQQQPSGALAVFADVELADGTLVHHCRFSRGRLTARRFVGVPVGVDTLGVHCVDRSGRTHDAVVPHRDIERGPAYEP